MSARPPTTPREHKWPRPRSAKRIVVVEDNPGDAELVLEQMQESLSSEYDVQHVTTLQEALRVLEHQAVEAVILDLNLPDSQGLETLQRVKEAADDAPVIVLSGLVDELFRDTAFDAGADEVLSKGNTESLAHSRSVLLLLERAQARQQHQQLQRLIDTTPDAIMIVNTQGVVRYVNQASVSLFGRTREEFLDESLGFSVRDGEATEIRIPHTGGDRFCEMRVVPMEWHLEHCFLATIRDVSERRRAEELRRRSAELEEENRRIEAANRLKSEFLANMSHELRTPLNAIIGFADLLHQGIVSPDSPKYPAYLDHISNSGKHLLKLINDILDFAKVEAGKLVFRPETLRIPHLVREVSDTLGALAGQRGLKVVVDCDPTVTEAFLDPQRLRQVLYNYLSNALKFTPDGGQVVVRTRPHGDSAFCLEVEDTGPGIAPDDLHRLFVEFQQLEAGSARRFKGTGLGLALTKKLVEHQGGSVDVQSTLGRGSTFRAFLPRRAVADEPSEAHGG